MQQAGRFPQLQPTGLIRVNMWIAIYASVGLPTMMSTTTHRQIVIHAVQDVQSVALTSGDENRPQ